MTTTMSMTERHKRVEELVMQDPLVRERASKFSDAQADISRWHVTNKTALRATIGQLDELDELIEYSEFCLEDLKCAKHRTYKHVMAQYPRVWDTTCPDPFTTDTQDKAEEMVTIRKDDAVDELVNIYGGHIDKWLEALRERTRSHPTEPTPQERDVYEQLWYGDVPELTLPKNFSKLSPMTLTHCARAIGLYMRMLKKHAPAFAEGYPSHVAHRLMDTFDETAEALETTLADGEGGER